MTDARKEPMNGKYGSDSKQIHSHPSEKTKEQLLDELMDYLCQTDEYTYDAAKHDAILTEIDKLDSAPQNTDMEESLAAFHKKYGSLFTPDVPSPSADYTLITPQKKRSHRKMLKVLPIAATLVLVLAIGANALSLGDIFGIFKSFTSEWFSVGTEDVPSAMITKMPLALGESAEYDSLQTAVDAFGITEDVAPKEFPKRFVLDSAVAINTDGALAISAEYISTDGYLFIHFRDITSNSRSFEMEGPTTYLHDYAGLSHRIMTNMDECNAYWQNGDLICSINGTVSQEEMIEIINSIYTEDNVP